MAGHDEYTAQIEAVLAYKKLLQEIHRWCDKHKVVHALGPVIALNLNGVDANAGACVIGWAPRCVAKMIQKRCDPNTPVTCLRCLWRLATKGAHEP